MILRELATRLGLEVDAASFAEGAAMVELAKAGLAKLADVAVEAAHQFVENVKGVQEYGDELHDTSMAMGVATDTLQEMRHAASLSGVGAAELDTSFKILSRTMAAAAHGGEAQAAVFHKIGVKVKNADGTLRDAADVMEDVSDHFKAMPDGAEKTALSMQLFGRAGAKLIPTLNEGSEGLAEMRQEARDLGLVMSKESIDAADELGDNMERLHAITAGLWRGAIAPLLPAINDLVKQYIAWRKANAAVMQLRIRQFTEGVIKVVKFLGTAFSVATKVISESVRILGEQWQVTLMIMTAALAPFIVQLVAAGIAATGTALGIAASWALAAAPFIAIGAAIAGVLLVLDDLKGYKEGKDSLFGRWKKTIDEWLKAGEGNQPWWLKVVKDFIRELRNAMEMIDEFNAKNIKGFVGEKVAEHFTGGPVPRNDKGEIDWWKSPSGFDWRYPFSGGVGPGGAGAGTPPGPAPMAAPGAGGGVVVHQTNSPVLNFPPGSNKDTVDYAYERLDEWYAGKMEEAAAALPATQ